MKAASGTLAAAARTTAFRLAAIYLAVFVLLAAAIVGTLFWQTSTLLTRQVLETVAIEVDDLAKLERAAGPQALAAAIADRSQTEEVRLYFLADAQGRKLAGNLSQWPPSVPGAPSGGLFRYLRGSNAESAERLAFGMAVETPGGERLLVGRNIDDQRQFVDRVKWLFLAGLAALVTAGIGIGILTSRSILNRINGMTRTSETIMAGDLSRRIAISGSGDEFDHLARNLNAMLDRIEQLMAGLREVSDNIAHDLKTPLNRLRNRVEAALRDPRGSDAWRDGLERALESADELIKTFNALLLIARLEARAIEESAETFDLGALVRDVAELYEPVAVDAGLELRLSGRDTVMMSGNRQLIGQAVANLVDNAIKYGASMKAAGSAARNGDWNVVRIDMVSTPDGVEVVVADRGPGIPAADRERVLKRFVRLEASRTAPGTGLGLSLAAAVARLHRGTVRLEDNEPGLKAVLALPARLLSAATSDANRHRHG